MKIPIMKEKVFTAESTFGKDAIPMKMRVRITDARVRRVQDALADVFVFLRQQGFERSAESAIDFAGFRILKTKGGIKCVSKKV